MSRGDNMNVFETIIFYLVFIVFPLTLWLLYQAYSKTMNKEKSNIFLDFALFSSMYLIVKFGIDQTTKLPILLFNVPLLIAYYKERHFSIIVLSILIINYYHYYLDFNLIILIIEYFIYYLLYLFIKIKKIKIETFVNIFVLIKLGFLVIKFIMSPKFISKIDCNNLEIIVIFVMFYLISHFVIYLFKTAEDILELHLKFCEIEHQKDITNSLFQITHEIKNPIAVCKGYLDMFDVNNVEHSKKYIPILKSEIDRLLLLLQDFLSINRINIDKDIIDINLLLEEMMKRFFPIFRSKNIKADFSIDEDEFYILADYNRLEQVLINLIKNSMEAIPKDRNGIISVYMKKGINNIKIYIKDNGDGISKENLEKLKSPFFTTKTRGTGLGVYLCNEIIEAHGGNIRYFSKENKGTKVAITLPYKKKDIKNFS